MKPIDCILPLTGSNESGIPEIIGSGALIAIGSEVFLITATHVFTDNSETTIYYPGETELLVLEGERISADRDKEDVSIMHINSDIANTISTNYIPLPSCFVEMNDVTSEGDHYMFTGFPEDLQGADPNTMSFRSKRFAYTSVVSSDRIYRKCNASTMTHIVLDHSKKRAKNSDGNITTPPTMHCVSGGGVWKKFDNVSGSPRLPQIRLVGIATEKHDKWGAIVATRIIFPMEAIRCKFPILSSIIPAPNTVNITCSDTSNTKRD